MNKYQVIKKCGDGSFGVVLKARHRETGEMLAIKQMKKKFMTWKECISLREVKSLQKLTKHPNIIRLLEVIREQATDELYFVFEYMDANLFQKMKEQHGQFWPESALKQMIYQVLQGLQYMHSQGFFHRDLKPENLLVRGDIVKIADFGLAKEIRSKPPYTDYVSTRWYRAPEIVLRSPKYNSPIDLWALGAIIVELFTMRPLFPGATDMDQIFKIIQVLGDPKEHPIAYDKTAPSSPLSYHGGGQWPDGIALAAQLGFRFQTIANAPLCHYVPNASISALQLIADLLLYEPRARPTASQCLNYVWFHDVVLPTGLTGGTATTDRPWLQGSVAHGGAKPHRGATQCLANGKSQTMAPVGSNWSIADRSDGSLLPSELATSQSRLGLSSSVALGKTRPSSEHSLDELLSSVEALQKTAATTATAAVPTKPHRDSAARRLPPDQAPKVQREPRTSRQPPASLSPQPSSLSQHHLSQQSPQHPPSVASPPPAAAAPAPLIPKPKRDTLVITSAATTAAASRAGSGHATTHAGGYHFAYTGSARHGATPAALTGAPSAASASSRNPSDKTRITAAAAATSGVAGARSPPALSARGSDIHLGGLAPAPAALASVTTASTPATTTAAAAAPHHERMLHAASATTTSTTTANGSSTAVAAGSPASAVPPAAPKASGFLGFLRKTRKPSASETDGPLSMTATTLPSAPTAGQPGAESGGARHRRSFVGGAGLSTLPPVAGDSTSSLLSSSGRHGPGLGAAPPGHASGRAGAVGVSVTGKGAPAPGAAAIASTATTKWRFFGRVDPASATTASAEHAPKIK